MKFVQLFLFLSCFILKGQELYFPPTDTDDWAELSFEELEWCPEYLDELYDYLQEKNTKAFLILKDGKIVVEAYFDGFHADSVWYWASAGKCVTSVLTGIAEQEGLLAFTDKTSDYLGEGWTSCTSEQENAITIWNQLTMTSGLDDGGDVFCTDPECLTFKAPAGTRWAYHNGPYTLLDGVLNEATGMPLNLYSNSRLEETTGMSGFFFPVDYNNVYFSIPRDMARFGLMVLNNGIWDGTPVINSDYVEAMTNTSQDLNLSYGYLWWLNGKESFMLPGSEIVFDGSPMPNAPSDMISALGKNGQIINIVPSQNLILIRMGDVPGGVESLVPTVLDNTIWDYVNQLMCESSGITAETKDKIQIYPNPSTGVFSIVNDSNETGNYIIYNQLGEVIFSGACLHGTNQIDMTTATSGIYECVIVVDGIFETKRLIIQ